MDRKVRDLILILLGVCAWDYVTSLWFEYRLLTKKIRFRWQFVPYFLARYFVLANIVLCVMGAFIDQATLPFCTHAVLHNATLYIALLAIVFSTWNLLIRTIIIWGHHPLVMKPLFAVGFLHFVLSFIASSVGRPPCTALPPSFVSVMIFGTTTAAIELAILVLSLVGIRRASRHRESPLARLLKTQGVAYFVMVLFLQLATIITNSVQADGVVRLCIELVGSTIGPMLSCRLVTSTLSQNSHIDGNPEARAHRIECFDLPQDQSQNPSMRITTYIDIPKDQSVC